MKKKRNLAVVCMTTIIVMLLAACTQSVGGDSGGGSTSAKPNPPSVTLNEAEKKIAGKTFVSSTESYTFNKDKTGIMSVTSKSIRAVVSGKFDWSASKGNDGNINITITQGENETEATYSESSGKGSIKIDNKTFDDKAATPDDSGTSGPSSGTPSSPSRPTNPTKPAEIVDAVVEEMNLVRANPADYAEKYIKPRLDWFKDASNPNNFTHGDVSGLTIVTQEGKAAVQECIDEMKAMANMTTPLATLKVEYGLRQAAKDHAADLAANGMMGHVGSDNSTLTMRVEKYGTATTPGENIAYGDYSIYGSVEKMAREIVINLLVDDGYKDAQGNKSRGHRLNILNGNYNVAGSYTTKYTTNPAGFPSGDVHVCVIDFANSYTTNSGVANTTGSLTDGTGSSGGSNELVGTIWYFQPSGLGRILYFKDTNTVVTAACSDKSQAISAVQGLSGTNGAVFSTYTYDASTKKGKINPFPKHDRYPDITVEGTSIVIPGLWQSQGDFTYDGAKKLTIKDPTYFGFNPSATPPAWEKVN